MHVFPWQKVIVIVSGIEIVMMDTGTANTEDPEGNRVAFDCIEHHVCGRTPREWAELIR